MTGALRLAFPPRVTFGPGAAEALPEQVAGLGDGPLLVVTGSDPSRHRSLVDRLPPAAVVSVRGEPTVQDVRTALAEGAHAGVVVAIGGGSVLDLGKAVAMVLANGGDPLDYLEVVGAGRPITEPSVPFVAVPTTAGSGAEATANAVLAVPERGVKASLRSPHMIPRLAVVDPVLTLGCPPAVTAASGMDALTQCLEPFVSPMANPVTDGWAREGLRLVGRSLQQVVGDGADLRAREEMAMAALLGGLSLANARLGAVHGFAGPLGGMCPASHGDLCAALAAPVVETNVAALPVGHPAFARYAEAAALLTGNPEAQPGDLVRWLHETTRELGVPGLSAAGLSVAEADEAVAKAAQASSMRGNPVELDAEQRRAIYLSAL